MNKKFTVIFTSIALLVVSGASIIALNQKGTQPLSMIPRAQTTDTTASLNQPAVQKKETALKEYSDPSGFRFLYPADLSVVVENNETDPELYAAIKLKPSSGIGAININVNSSNFNKLDEWLRANKIAPSASNIKRTSLADLVAYQVTIEGQIVTGALDEGALFTVVLTEPRNESLLSSYVKIINNFSFYEPPGAANADNTADTNTSNGIYTEPEEVIE